MLTSGDQHVYYVALSECSITVDHQMAVHVLHNIVCLRLILYHCVYIRMLCASLSVS